MPGGTCRVCGGTIRLTRAGWRHLRAPASPHEAAPLAPSEMGLVSNPSFVPPQPPTEPPF